ncbi:MAG: transposase [Bacillota bacterium]|nr:transposase [Bacillota bacterium]
MPRTARKKHGGAIFHIMVRSISELILFKDAGDSDRYLNLIKKYQKLYLFNVYSYCLMGNHAHLIIDCCGADISKIMKSINQSYAMYYNIKYKRHGHVFQDRFKSKIVDNNDYLITLSAYIHNNPKDINRYKDDVASYPYSSLSIFLGTSQDRYYLLNSKFILELFSNNVQKARKTYLELLKHAPSIGEEIHIADDAEFKIEEKNYRSERNFVLREVPSTDIKAFIEDCCSTSFNPLLKYNRKNNEMKAVYIVILRCLCNLSIKNIGLMFENMTPSNVWRLSEKGCTLICSDSRFKNIITDLIALKKSLTA